VLCCAVDPGDDQEDLRYEGLINFFPNQMFIAPWVRTMDAELPLISMETGSGLPDGLLAEELGISLSNQAKQI